MIKISLCHPSLCNPTATQWWAASTEARIIIAAMLGEWIWSVWEEVLWKAYHTGKSKQTALGGRDRLMPPAPQNPKMCWWNPITASAAREAGDDAAKGTSWLRSAFNNSYFVKLKGKERKLEVICIRLELEDFHLARQSYVKLWFSSDHLSAPENKYNLERSS